jgi:hypothetical protein
MGRSSILIVAMLGIAVAGPASAGDYIDAKERKARIECAAGNYQEGIRMLAQLWVATEDPTFIYNQGRCYEQNGQYELAAGRFREYLRKATRLPAADISAINRHIDELQGQASVRSAPAPTVIKLVQTGSAGQPAPPAAPPPPPQPPVSVRSVELVSPPAAPSESPPRFYTRWWLWTGVGAVVAGGVVTALLLMHSGSKSPACDQGVPCAP